MKTILVILSFIFSYAVSSQTTNKAIKFIPQMSLKVGSQKPAIGGQFDLVAGILFNDKYLLGLGGGYCTNMGMGGKTFPLYADIRMFFSTKNKILFASKDVENNFHIAVQLGMDINNNQPYKTGFLAACEFAYKFDFIKIKQHNFPTFYAGIGVEYNYSKFKDVYHGFLIQDGVLKHIMFNLKVAFDIPPIKL
jgi:hypothetical protein